MGNQYLAEYNKNAIEALEKEKKREVTSGEGEDTSEGWSAQSVAIGVLVVGLTAFNLFYDIGISTNREPPPLPNTLKTTPMMQHSKIPVPIPKVGMQ